jgi:quercetin dioxygenase-like cupin family protein
LKASSDRILLDLKKISLVKIKPDKNLKSKKKYFVGDASLSDISTYLDIKGQKVYFAIFKNGARTKVHYHEGGQVLVITSGTGTLVMYKKTNLKKENVAIQIQSQTNLKRGDIVFIPKNNLHWHGALKGKNFAHIAFNIFTEQGVESQTIWYDSDFLSYVRMIK